jgi:hypothetical protein
MKIRNSYKFTRPLTPPEGDLLLLLIGWRKGSAVRQTRLDRSAVPVAPMTWKTSRKELGERVVCRHQSALLTRETGK